MADNEANLQILKRVDPDVDEVLATAGHVCLYYMHVDSQQWTRKNVEGSLFLLKRKKAPRFQVMVLNKLSTDNYVESIHGNFDFEVNAPYLMYTHGNSEIHGIWFYEEEDLNRLSTLLNRVKAGLPKTDILPTTVQQQQQQTSETVENSGNDKAFWDTQVDVSSGQVPLKADMQFQQRSESMQPLLPPSFFQSQQSTTTVLHVQQSSIQNVQVASAIPSKQLNDLRKAAALSPVSSGPIPSSFSGPAGGGGAADSNALQKLFNKALAPGNSSQPVAVSQGSPMMIPTSAVLASAAQKLTVSEQQQPPVAIPIPVAPASQQQNPLSKLFSQASMSSRLSAPSAPSQDQQDLDQKIVMRAKMRQAFSRLMANDTFVDMMADELKSAGVL